VSDLSNSTPIPIDNDPRAATLYRGLKAAVIILGVLIVIALAVLVAGLIMRFSGHSIGGGSGRSVLLPPGAAITGTAVQNNRLIIRMKTADGEEIDIIDAGDGHLVGRIRTLPPSVP
jgi:hypothetical protein